MSLSWDTQDMELAVPRPSTARAQLSPPPPTSPTPSFIENGGMDHRGSIVSQRSTGSTVHGVRRRHRERSHTLTTYQQHVHHEEPAAEPGIDVSANQELLPPFFLYMKTACQIKIIDFNDIDDVQINSYDNAGLAAALDKPRPENSACRWISVNGLSSDVISMLGTKYNLHRLAIEDLCHPPQRTKVDWYADHAFILLSLLKLVKLHRPRSNDYPVDDRIYYGESDDKGAGAMSHFRWWWRRRKTPEQWPDFPDPLDKAGNGTIDEYVNAHSNTSDGAPLRPTRTLHRYETQNPEHTAFMEAHSVLSAEDMAVSVEQVSIFLLAENTVISFFEQSASDLEEPIIRRLRSRDTMIRRSCDASLLLQSIIDGIVDLAVPVKEAYNKARKDLQVDAMTSPNIRTSRALHIFGEEIDMLQNLVKPLVALVNALRDHNTDLGGATPIQVQAHNSGTDAAKSPTKRDREGVPKMGGRLASDYRRVTLKRTSDATTVSITPLAHTYFGDVLDHCITLIQALEQMDASAGNISTLIFNTVGAKTNNFMMILAIVTVLFAPLTFVTGYFGMNFAAGNGLDHPFAFFWVVAVPSLVGFGLLVFATMLWESIRDMIKSRHIKSSRSKRRPRT